MSGREKGGIIVKDTSNDSVRARTELQMPLIDASEPGYVPGDFGINGDKVYVRKLDGSILVLGAVTPEPLLVLSSNNNTQMMGFGSFTGQKAYFGTTTGGPDPVVLLPANDVVLNIGGFIEDTTYSQGGPVGIRGAPGWRVPKNGLYKISASVPVSATVTPNFPPDPNTVGPNVNPLIAEFNATLQIAVNNNGFLSTNFGDASTFWKSQIGLIPQESYIGSCLCGFIYVPLTTADYLFAGINTQHNNSGMNIFSSSLEVRFIN